MKKFNFLSNLLRKKFVMSVMSGMNGLRADAVNPDSLPTVNQQSRLTSEQRHYSVTSARVAQEWLNGSSRLRVVFDSFTCRLRVCPLKRVAVFAILLTIGVGNVWADTYTWTVTTGEQEWFASRTSGKAILNGKAWYFTRSDATSTTYDGTYACMQLGKDGSPDDVVLLSNAFNGTITQIDIECSSYSGKHTCQIEVGGSTVLEATTITSGATPGTTTTGTISKTGVIKITFTKGSGARYLRIKSITVKYETGTANVSWVVGGTTTKSETGVSTGTPPDVADNALGASCSGIVFLGWSETNIGNSPTSAPLDLFDANEVPPTSGDKTYYAIFGEVETYTGDTVLVQFPLYDTWSYSGTTSDKSSYRLFAKDAYVQSGAFDVSRLAKVIVKARYYSAADAGYFAIKDAEGNSWNTGSAPDNSFKECIFRSGSSLSGFKAMRVIATSASANGSSKGLGMSSIRYYVFPKVYSNCISMCCTPLGEVDDDEIEFTETAFTINVTWGKTEGEHETGYSLQLYDNNGTGVKGSAIGDPVEIDGAGDSDRTYTFGAKTPVGSRLTANHEYFVGITPTYDGDGDYCASGTEVSANTTTGLAYTVTYAAGTGGSGTMTDSNNPYEAGDEVTVLENEFTKCGYPFTGWSAVDAGSNVVDVSSGSFAMPAANVTITATWSESKSKDVYYDRMSSIETSNERSGSYSTPAAKSDKAEAVGCEGQHKHFIGWVVEDDINEDGSLKLGATIYEGSQSGMCAEGKNYYAVWADEE